MHYVTLATVSIPPLEENEEENAAVAAEAAAAIEKYKDSFLESLYRGIYKGQATTFSRTVESAVEIVMEPFYPDSFYSYINEGEWFSYYEYDCGGKADDTAGKEKWHNQMHKFIDDLPDDEVLVVVDCHT